MPNDLQRLHHSGQSHFVTFSCYHRLPYLQSAEACDVFVAALEQTRLRYHFHVYGFVVMPEHVHLLISEPERGIIANALQSLKISSSKLTAPPRESDGQRSPLWQKRYYDRNVRDYEETMRSVMTAASKSNPSGPPTPEIPTPPRLLPHHQQRQITIKNHGTQRTTVPKNDRTHRKRRVPQVRAAPFAAITWEATLSP